MTQSVPLGIMDRSVPSGSHVCAFYSGPAGRDEVVLPFLAEGLRTGHKCLAVLDSTSQGEVLAKLYDRGVDADQAAQAGQIEVETPANAYFRSGTFSTDDIIAFWGQGIDKARTPARSASSGRRARCRRSWTTRTAARSSSGSRPC